MWQRPGTIEDFTVTGYSVAVWDTKFEGWRHEADLDVGEFAWKGYNVRSTEASVRLSVAVVNDFS